LASNATGEDEGTNQNVIVDVGKPKHRLLKTAAIYGANASGKSNLIEAISFFCNFVRDSAKEGQSGEKIPIDVFRLDARCAAMPSSFEIVFLRENIRHEYRFVADGERIHHERLRDYPKGQPRKVFERRWDPGEKTYAFEKGSGWIGEWKTLQDLTRPNALFLSVAAQLNNELAGRIVEWIGGNIKFLGLFPEDNTGYYFTLILAQENLGIHNAMLKWLRHVDPGIADFEIKFDEFAAFGDSTSVYPVKTKTVVTIHQGVAPDGTAKPVLFRLEQESHGTQRFFSLLFPLYVSLESGFTLVADELDTRLHPLITRWIINLFHDPKTNPHTAQLVFATHDAGLLGKRLSRRGQGTRTDRPDEESAIAADGSRRRGEELFRRDQIWLTHKENGATRLYSLWDLRIRNTEDLRANYLLGRYGGVPFIDELDP